MPGRTRNPLQFACEAADREHQHWLKRPDPEQTSRDDMSGQLRRNVIEACEKVLETIEQHEWRESTMMGVPRLFSHYVKETSTTLFGNVWTALQPMFTELCKQSGLDPESHYVAFQLEWNSIYDEQVQRSLNYVMGIAEHMFDIAAGAKPFPTPPPSRIRIIAA